MEKDQRVYLCDRKKCAGCSYPTCKHTTDINHAKNRGKLNEFERQPDGSLFEREGADEVE